MPIKPDPVQSAQVAGLEYVSDDKPGYTRVRRGGGFRFLDADGKPIKDKATLERLRHFVIPPAYENVWISPNPNGHIQVTARDARGRKQYIYHERWRQVRDSSKFCRVLAFARQLPALRQRVAEDMARPGIGREKVLALVVRLLETTLIRVGNEEYARTNESFGLTTLLDEHVEVKAGKIEFKFRAKSGKFWELNVREARLAKLVKKCQDLPGQHLFEYIGSDGVQRPVTSADVNAYLREITGEEFSAKDFRTWAATTLAAQAFHALAADEAPCSKAAEQRQVRAAITQVAKKLGNTVAVCRQCYIHPEIVNAHLDGTLKDSLSQRVDELLEPGHEQWSRCERDVLELLQKRLEQPGTSHPSERAARTGERKRGRRE